MGINFQVVFLVIVGSLAIWSCWLMLARVDSIQSLPISTPQIPQKEEVTTNISLAYWYEPSSQIKNCEILKYTLKYAPQCGEEIKKVYPLLITGTGRVGTMFASQQLRRAGYDISHDNERVGKFGAAAWPLAIRETNAVDRFKYGSGGYAIPNFAHALGSQFFGTAPSARFAVILQQTRHPLATIASRADRVGMMYAPISYSNPHLFRDVLHYAPSFPPQSELQAWYNDRHNSHEWNTEKRLRVALFHYVFFNEWVNAYADATYQVEHFDLQRIILFAQLGKIQHSHSIRHLLSLPHHNNKIKKQPARYQYNKERPNHHAAKYISRNLTWADLRRVSPFVASRAQDLAQSFGYL
uniref:Sulfotransferase domain-containing protein n=1 Tax=Aureoumbra lagunensis TaxID=44058 RepID=A0A7S3NKW0_9STRA|mmetsp:Transcript_21875/g.33679  ORF Transcript_21875/g.33679 Transcript_21875/m.33679 type:complete len:354 (+) Transcript_21875:300-1361(+)